MWTEYLNRLLGVTVGFLIFATLIAAIRHHRHVRQILWPTAAAFLLTGFQGWLGGRVVAHELASWIVTVHLLVALVIVSLLLYATLYAFYKLDPRPAARRPTAATTAMQRRLAWATLGLIVVTLAQVTLGAQVRGRVDAAKRWRPWVASTSGIATRRLSSSAGHCSSCSGWSPRRPSSGPWRERHTRCAVWCSFRSPSGCRWRTSA
jgi:heme A synthase